MLSLKSKTPLRHLFLILYEVPALGVEVLKGVILFYRWVISPLLGPRCRFFPSCSAYALEALQKYGMLKGTRLILMRVAKCHPWHPGGVDLLP